jgi:hypothetical protein
MGYLNQFEAELEHMLEKGGSTAEIIRFVSEKVLESYRNGIKAGKAGESVIRDGKSRRGGETPQAR